MDHSDIRYIVELLSDSFHNKDWDGVIEATEFLKEFLDDDGSPIDLEE